jgi:hypothetical protein
MRELAQRLSMKLVDVKAKLEELGESVDGEKSEVQDRVRVRLGLGLGLGVQAKLEELGETVNGQKSEVRLGLELGLD